MRAVFASVVVAGLIWGQGAAAQDDAPQCRDSRAAMVDAAIDQAKALAIQAAANIADTPHYARWFGPYRADHAERLRGNFKSIVQILRGGGLRATCLGARDPDCRGDVYAFVYSDDAGLIYLCPLFFTLPSLVEIADFGLRADDGTREGTIIHEISHFDRVAGTDDHCYSRDICRQMARASAARAVDNADSYQFFAEDVALAARAQVGGKTSP